MLFSNKNTFFILMEPEVREFLKRISFTLFTALVWLAINATAAIKGDNAFISDHIRLGNVLFYIWFAISIFLLLIVLRKIWTAKEPVE